MKYATLSKVMKACMSGQPASVIQTIYESYLQGLNYIEWRKGKRVEYDALPDPGITFSEWIVNQPAYEEVPVDGLDFANKEDAKAKMREAVEADWMVVRLLLSLMQTLVDKGVISQNDFSPEEREMFQKVRALYGRIF